MALFYRYETKGIQRWILDSNRLRDLQGGSALIDHLAETARAKAEELHAVVIQAAAGGMTARFESLEGLEAFASEWPMFVHYAAPGLQMVQAWMQGEKESPELHRSLRRKLADTRNVVWPDLPEAGPWVQRAGRSGLPAMIPFLQDVDRGRKQTNALDRAGVMREWARGAPSPLVQDLRFDDDVDRWDEGPVGIVHIDGNKVGDRLQKLAGSLAEFSRQLSAATNSATRSACEQLDGYPNRCCGRPIVVGGDDVTFVLPARKARAFSEAWLRAFQEATAELDGGSLTAAAGIAYVHAHFPFHRGYEIAEQCCRAAKREANGRNALRFVRVTTALEDDADWACVWETGSVQGDTDSPLERLTKATIEIPRGTLRTWLGLFERPESGKTSAQRQALWRRAGEVANADAWVKFGDALEAAGADRDAGTLHSDPHRTPIHDVLTLHQVEGGRS